MKVAALLTLALLAAGPAAQAQSHPDHVVVQPQDVKWGPAPDFLPPGAQFAVLYGDPSKNEEYALRLKLPDGYLIAPHTHPAAEIVTVLKGQAHLGMGATVDKAKTMAVPTGGFFAIQPEMAHYAYTTGETILQVNGGKGPFMITYVNPKDDPRKK